MTIRRSSFHTVFLALFLSIFMTGCAQTELLSTFFKNPQWGSRQASQGNYKIGNPYKVEGIWYYPQEDFQLVETGIASWYGPGFHAEQTANGERFDQNQLTAAHRTLQMPSFVKVTNLENGRSVIVRVNDRGPFKSGRVMDVSKRAAQVLGFTAQGTARVRIQVMEEESRAIAEAAKRGESTIKMTYEYVHEQIKQDKIFANRVEKSREEERIEEAANPDNQIPESLMTPTITVEALKDDVSPIDKISYRDNPAAKFQPDNRPKPVIGKSKDYAQPVSVAGTEPVARTGIFVQAGSFLIYDNAKNLAKNLADIGPTVIENVEAKGRTLYRVKVGPIATVAEADNILSRVIQEGMSTAMIIGKKQAK